MKPDREASVWARPTVWRIWATPYMTPRPTPIRSSRPLRASIRRQNTATIAAAAIVKRTARKSVGGSTRTTSRIRKNVEPQIAVAPTSSSVATCRERAVVNGVGRSDHDERDGRAARCRGSRGDRLVLDKPEQQPTELLFGLHREAQALNDRRRFSLRLPQDIGDHDGLGALGDDEGDGVPLEQRAGCGGLADHRALGHGVAPVSYTHLRA